MKLGRIYTALMLTAAIGLVSSCDIKYEQPVKPGEVHTFNISIGGGTLSGYQHNGVVGNAGKGTTYATYSEAKSGEKNISLSLWGDSVVHFISTMSLQKDGTTIIKDNTSFTIYVSPSDNEDSSVAYTAKEVEISLTNVELKKIQKTNCAAFKMHFIGTFEEDNDASTVMITGDLKVNLPPSE